LLEAADVPLANAANSDNENPGQVRRRGVGRRHGAMIW